MKKIIVFIFLFVSATAFAQVEDTTAQPAITEAGKPTGKIAEKMMNKDGGTLFSGDGKLELIIPSGALSKKTTISIQPITNTMPNGNGQAFRLEPSGIQFQKPVQLVFHYTDEESKDSMQLLMGIAMQNNTGQWYSLKKFTLDTVAKTMSGNINHFSDWSNFDKIKLYPSSARLKVKKTMNLSIDLISSEEEDLSPFMQDDLSPLKKQKIPWTVTWRANEIIKGNAVVGKIADALTRFITYTAPDAVPAQNPVAVTADLKGLTYKYKGVVFKDLKLVSNILIYDNAYEVKMISSIKGNAGSVLGAVNYKDEGSFVVSLNGKESKIIEKLNNNIKADFNYNGKCTIKQIKPGWGNIHVIKAQSIKVIPATSPTGPTWVEITFPFTPTVFPLLHFTCPPIGRGQPYSGTNAVANGMAARLPTFPSSQYPLKFKAIDEEQTILQIGEEGGEWFFKCIVKQLKDD